MAMQLNENSARKYMEIILYLENALGYNAIYTEVVPSEKIISSRGSEYCILIYSEKKRTI